MSSILKALRKLEQEKSSRKSGIVDVTGQVIYKKERPQRQTWRIPMAMAAVGITTAIGTYFLTTAYSRNGIEQHAVPAPPVAQQPVQVAATPQPVEAANDRIAPPPMPVEAKKAALSVHLPTPLLGHIKSAATPPAPPAVARTTPAAPAVQPSPPPVRPQTTAPVQTARVSYPTLDISGVAYGAGGGKFAIINGVAVTEGSSIAGAKVEEILQDRVRFTFDKKTFDVPVGKK